MVLPHVTHRTVGNRLCSNNQNVYYEGEKKVLGENYGIGRMNYFEVEDQEDFPEKDTRADTWSVRLR